MIEKVKLISKIGMLRRKKRFELGTVNFEKEERVFILDEKNNPVSYEVKHVNYMIIFFFLF